MSNRAIIVVDIQNEYFPGGKLPLESIETAATNAAKVIEHARSVKDLVIHVRHESAHMSAAAGEKDRRGAMHLRDMPESGLAALNSNGESVEMELARQLVA
ncbi:isochorismatase family protein [Halomonas binhaiensis]|uniref:Isochorismatase family protein n=1 Tax=Halomonas binhaiensis TaxID=2562282 RepID=A0A5C1NJI4_9GAMM|nr:isochorismatase family protein [Halomonas binhaiensis]